MFLQLLIVVSEIMFFIVRIVIQHLVPFAIDLEVRSPIRIINGLELKADPPGGMHASGDSIRAHRAENDILGHPRLEHLQMDLIGLAKRLGIFTAERCATSQCQQADENNTR
jgi:hypothetical protein